MWNLAIRKSPNCFTVSMELLRTSFPKPALRAKTQSHTEYVIPFCPIRNFSAPRIDLLKIVAFTYVITHYIVA